MKRILALLLAAALALCGVPLSAAAETILWEDENGVVILEDDGNIEFGTPTPLPTATPAPQTAPTGPALADAALLAPALSASPTPLPAPEKTLQYGDSGEYVLAAQNALTELGYYHGECSGRFLEGTQSAARRFQKLNGLKQTGKLDAATWAALFSPAAVARDGSTPYATPSPVPVLTPTPTPAPFDFKGTLRYGDNGERVSALQTRLAELGFYNARVSGGYYQVTKSAVRDFQAHNGLTADGVAGRETQELLFSAAAVAASGEARPTPTPVPAQYALMVDVANQITRAYTYDENGEYTVLVREMICSTGTKGHETPLGTTVMPSKRARWGYFPTWGSHAQYLTRIDSANAFHSVLYAEPNEFTLNESSFNALGTRASHGCVRLLVSDAKWIYDNCKAGTIITIYEGEYDPEYTMTLKPTLNRQTQRENPLPEPTPEPVYSPENWPTEYRTLSRGKTGQDVYMVQMRLRELGYYAGTVTGGYYGGTIAAVEAFQRANGLSVDGAAGAQTQGLLFSQSALPAASATSATGVLDTQEPPVPSVSPDASVPGSISPAPGDGSASPDAAQQTPVPPQGGQMLNFSPLQDNVG